MKTKLLALISLLAFSLTTTSASYAAKINVDQKHPNDKRSYRSITLANKLEAYLISDPSFNKSAAALDIRVGSMANPKNALGLAHYLEHVLFLGTKKFPEPDEFVAFVEGNQGNWNAYTSSESTNYHFDINHNALEGALKRFSLFFTEPTFNEKFLDKELNAVHSEYKKNLDSDDRRIYAVYQKLIKKDHPASYFTVGNQTTLGKVTKKQVVKFYEENYSSNIMKLVLMSKDPLDKMEKLARKYFSPIKNKNLKPNKYSPEIFNEKKLPLQVNIQTIKDIKKLELVFPIKHSMDPYWKSKPHLILGHLIGHEGKGSLLSKLKKENLVSGVGSSSHSSSYASTFSTEFTLTDKGLKNIDQVITHFYSYINLVKSNGYKKYIFDEESAIRAIDYVYREQREGVSVASGFASMMQKQPASEMEKRQALLTVHNEKNFKNYLKDIHPKNMIILLSAKNAPIDLATAKEEPYFKAKYTTKKISSKRIKNWEKAASKKDKSMSYPEKNTFIPKNLAVNKFKKSDLKKVIDSKWGVFWYQTDSKFLLPKAEVQLTLLTDAVNKSPRAKMLANLYTSALQRTLEEWKYPITLAGLSFSINRTDRGIGLHFSGYSENIPQLITTITTKLKTIDIDQKTFADVKDQLKRMVMNQKKSAAYRQAMYHLQYLSDSKMIHPKYYYNPVKGSNSIDLITPATLKEVKQFASQVYSNIAIEGAGYGNIPSKEITEAINAIPSILKSDVLAKTLRGRSLSLFPEKARPVAAKLRSEINNNAWVSDFTFGKRSAELHAALEVGNALLKANFFKELRTNQQLGYIVASWVNESDNLLGMTFLIQSDQFSPDKISQKSRIWMQNSLEELNKLSEKDFKDLKKAVALKYREKIKTISEQLSRINYETFVVHKKGYNEKVAKAAEKLKKSDMVKIFKKAFKSSEERSISVYLSKKDGAEPKVPEKLIRNGKKFKKSARYF